MNKDELIKAIEDYDEDNYILSGGVGKEDVIDFAQYLVEKFNVSIKEQYKELTKVERQDLNENYCDYCLIDE